MPMMTTVRGVARWDSLNIHDDHINPKIFLLVWSSGFIMERPTHQTDCLHSNKIICWWCFSFIISILCFPGFYVTVRRPGISSQRLVVFFHFDPLSPHTQMKTKQKHLLCGINFRTD